MAVGRQMANSVILGFMVGVFAQAVYAALGTTDSRPAQQGTTQVVTWGSFRRLVARYQDLRDFCGVEVDRESIRRAGEEVARAINTANKGKTAFAPSDLVTMPDNQVLPGECLPIWQRLEHELRRRAAVKEPPPSDFWPRLPELR